MRGKTNCLVKVLCVAAAETGRLAEAVEKMIEKKKRGDFMKQWIAMLAAGTVLTTSSMALAAEPVKFSGDVTVKYEKDTAEGADDVAGTMSSVRLKGEADMGKG